MVRILALIGAAVLGALAAMSAGLTAADLYAWPTLVVAIVIVAATAVILISLIGPNLPRE